MKAVAESVHIVKCYEIKWIHGKNHLIKIDTFIIADIIYSFVHGFRSISTQNLTKKNLNDLCNWNEDIGLERRTSICIDNQLFLLLVLFCFALFFFFGYLLFPFSSTQFLFWATTISMPLILIWSNFMKICYLLFCRLR